MREFLQLIAILSTGVALSQSGNTINDANEIDGVGLSINVTDFDLATISGLLPDCGLTEDVFYYNSVSTGDNKITIGMTSLGVSLATSIEYQILLAPEGNIANLQEITCDSYSVLLIDGGSFDFVIDNVNPNDVFYLRIYKTAGLGVVLNDLLNGTSITMTSVFDASLTNGDFNQKKFKLLVNNDVLKLLNNKDYLEYEVYALDGKKVSSGKSKTELKFVDISKLNMGIYVVNFAGNGLVNSYRFIKN